MEFNNKRLKKVSKLINVFISIILCSFLILLSSKVMNDIDNWSDFPDRDSFKNEQLLKTQGNLKLELLTTINKKEKEILDIEFNLNIAQSDYHKVKQSFDTWIKTRAVTKAKSNNLELQNKANELDQFYEIEQRLVKGKKKIDQEIYEINSQIEGIDAKIKKEDKRSYKIYEQAVKSFNLKVFFTRLLFVLPILGIGIWFLLKFRKNKYWPIYRGGVLFSFYTFFIGLVPYLPSYGGYIRYSVGIVLSLLFGMYVIDKIRNFIEKKKTDLKKSSNERAKKVQSETAETAFDNDMCPSCGKGFVVIGWDKTIKTKNKPIKTVLTTNFCRFCGLQLFKSCKSCNTENFAHLPFCSNCGDEICEKSA